MRNLVVYAVWKLLVEGRRRILHKSSYFKTTQDFHRITNFIHFSTAYHFLCLIINFIYIFKSKNKYSYLCRFSVLITILCKSYHICIKCTASFYSNICLFSYSLASLFTFVNMYWQSLAVARFCLHLIMHQLVHCFFASPPSTCNAYITK